MPVSPRDAVTAAGPMDASSRLSPRLEGPPLLHLAAMQSDGLQRLLTNDDAQANLAPALELGLAVIMPR